MIDPTEQNPEAFSSEPDGSELPIDLDERGRVLWHCSEEDGGPDVGLSLGLGNGWSLYFGEMPTSTLADNDIDVAKTGDGWWVVMYGPGRSDTYIAGLIVDEDSARVIFDKITEALSDGALPRQEKSPASSSVGTPSNQGEENDHG